MYRQMVRLFGAQAREANLGPDRSLASGSITSPHPPREPSSASVDATLALDELIQRLRVRLVDSRVPQNPAPLAASPFVSLGRVGSAPNDSGERIFPIRHFQPM
jgi:hypothetical protein